MGPLPRHPSFLMGSLRNPETPDSRGQPTQLGRVERAPDARRAFRLTPRLADHLHGLVVGAIVLLSRNALAHAGLVRWLHRAAPLRSGAWIATLQALSIRPHSRLLILECAADHGPCTWGFVRPVLMLPAGGDAWSESWRRHALLHEQAHLDRRDAVTTLIARMACALHWFNPLVWLGAAQLRLLQEKACDDAVLRAGVRPSDYAQFLLDMARRKGGEPDSAAILGVLGCSPLQTRISSILDCTRSRTERGRISSLAGLCVLGALSVILAAIAFVTPTNERNSPVLPIASNATIQKAAYARVWVSAHPIPIIATAGRPFKSRLPTSKAHPPRPGVHSPRSLQRQQNRRCRLGRRRLPARVHCLHWTLCLLLHRYLPSQPFRH